MRAGGVIGVLACLLVPCASSIADTQTFVATRDNSIYSEGAFSNGAGIYMFAGMTAQNNRRRALLTFDLSAIPAGSTITAATLRLQMSRSVGGEYAVGVHRVLADWGSAGSDATANEGMGAPAQTGDATWTHRFHNTTPWATVGGDFVGAASAIKLVDDVGAYFWSGAGMEADVQAWVDGAAANFGWILIGEEAFGGTAKRFNTRENGSASTRPQLTVEWIPIPAPGAAALSIVAAAFAARRRR